MHNNQYNAGKNLINFRAFLPARKDDELSISRTDGLTDADVWAMGDSVVAAPSGRTVVARGDFRLREVRELRVDAWRLRIHPDEPPPRHAVIVGWPPQTETDARKRFAQELRALATSYGRPH